MNGKSLPESASRVIRLIVLCCGLLLLGLGFWSFLDPGIFTQLYGIKVVDSTAKVALRAMIGGGEIGLGMFMLVGGSFNVSLWSRLMLATFGFGSVFIARTCAVLLDWPTITEALIREVVIEGFIFFCLLFGVLLTALGDRNAH